MGQKNFAHGHAAFLIGITLLIIGVILLLIEKGSVFGNTWIAWAFIIIGTIELIIGGMAFGAHAKADSEVGEKKEGESENKESGESKKTEGGAVETKGEEL